MNSIRNSISGLLSSLSLSVGLNQVASALDPLKHAGALGVAGDAAANLPCVSCGTVCNWQAPAES